MMLFLKLLYNLFSERNSIVELLLLVKLFAFRLLPLILGVPFVQQRILVVGSFLSESILLVHWQETITWPSGFLPLLAVVNSS